MSGSLRWRIGSIAEEGAGCRGCPGAARGRRRRRLTSLAHQAPTAASTVDATQLETSTAT
ncbi:hypothetical protein HMPREF9056_00176 [Actinomyces sp. oral taxon 170 str. F0386]|nr:hypothetical protein HMPREF9056_00176 [Actinomyces sp. oral taxon 170 str. F0386]